MYLVISDDGSFPDYLKKEQIELYNINEFTAIASSDDGITIDEGIFINVLNISKYIVEALEQYRTCGVEIKYFNTSNIAWPNYIPLEAIDDDFAHIGVAFGKKIREIL